MTARKASDGPAAHYIDYEIYNDIDNVIVDDNDDDSDLNTTNTDKNSVLQETDVLPSGKRLLW